MSTTREGVTAPGPTTMKPLTAAAAGLARAYESEVEVTVLVGTSKMSTTGGGDKKIKDRHTDCLNAMGSHTTQKKRKQSDATI
jgi:hypothetical protein